MSSNSWNCPRFGHLHLSAKGPAEPVASVSEFTIALWTAPLLGRAGKVRKGPHVVLQTNAVKACSLWKVIPIKANDKGISRTIESGVMGLFFHFSLTLGSHGARRLDGRQKRAWLRRCCPPVFGAGYAGNRGIFLYKRFAL
jgi:hypothetical protein